MTAWDYTARDYRDDVRGARTAYHEGRLATAERLLAQAALAPGATIIDFGCGEGTFARRLSGFAVTGIDPSPEMVALAREQGVDAEVGGVELLRRCDALVSLNVLAYLTDDEHQRFWTALDCDALLVSHSNALFDEFAGGSAPYNVRANPLTLRDDLAARGFDEVERAYFNFHPRPPAELGAGDEGRIFDPGAIAARPEAERERQCSTVFVLASRKAIRNAP
jgi:SAM-dependent methyltransferase